MPEKSASNEIEKALKDAGLDKERRESFWKRAEYIDRAGRLGFGRTTLTDLGKLAEGLELFGVGALWEKIL